MPRKEVKYYCEMCNRPYTTVSEANQCERLHLSIKDISPKFNFGDRKKELPTTILVTLSDGKKIEYYRERG